MDRIMNMLQNTLNDENEHMQDVRACKTFIRGISPDTIYISTRGIPVKPKQARPQRPRPLRPLLLLGHSTAQSQPTRIRRQALHTIAALPTQAMVRQQVSHDSAVVHRA